VNREYDVKTTVQKGRKRESCIKCTIKTVLKKPRSDINGDILRAILQQIRGEQEKNHPCIHLQPINNPRTLAAPTTKPATDIFTPEAPDFVPEVGAAPAAVDELDPPGVAEAGG
jgi:hypothetical protein